MYVDLLSVLSVGISLGGDVDYKKSKKVTKVVDFVTNDMDYKKRFSVS